MTQITLRVEPYKPKQYQGCGCVEDIGKTILQKEGWTVYHSRQHDAIITKLRKCKGGSCLVAREDQRYLWVGCPDLFAFKQWETAGGISYPDFKFKFVEIKSAEDGLHLNQFLWMAAFGFPTEIMFLVPEDEVTQCFAFVHALRGKERSSFLELVGDLAKIKKVIKAREDDVNRFRVE